MEINPVEPATLPPGELRMRVDTILEHEKQSILELYRLHPLDELIDYLRTLHGVSVRRRHVVYKLGIWGASKDNNRDEENLSSILGQHIQELVKTGSLFANPNPKGCHLFKWANEADQIIHDFRHNDSHDTLSPSSFTKLLKDLNGVITDEHPQLIRVLFGVWEGITQIDDTNTASRYFIHQVYDICQELLGEDNLIRRTFGCLNFGVFKPAECLELLELLPAKLFAQKSESLGPSFETSNKTNDKTNAKTNDYQTISSESRKTAVDFWVQRSLSDFSQHTLSKRKRRHNIGSLAIRHLFENNDGQERRLSKSVTQHFPWNTLTERWLADPSHGPPYTSLQPPPNIFVSPNGAKNIAFGTLLRSQTQSFIEIERSNELDTEDSWPPQKPGHVSPPLLEQVGQSSIKTLQYNPSKDSLEGSDFDVLELSGNQTSDCQTPDNESPDYRSKTQSTWSPHENERQVAVGESSGSPYGESDITSDSTADEQQQQMRAMEAERRQIVQTVMDAFLHDLDSHLEDITGNFVAIKEEDAGEPTQAPSGAEGLTKGEQGQKPRKQQKLCGKGGDCGRRKGKGLADDGDEDDESAEDGDGSERRRKVPSMQDGPKVIPLACPYFKWDPHGCPRKKECAGPGWPSVHRVKEHLYRRHGSPFECPRCRRDLKAQSALNSHLKLAQICEVNNELNLSGRFRFGPDIERRLRVRCSSKQTEADKWKHVYRTLFDVREDEIPTPYYDHDVSAIDREETWKEYTRREIMILLRERIEAEVGRRFAAMAPELIDGLRDIVHDLELVLRENFEKSREQARTIDRDEAFVRPPSLPVAGESSTNTAQTPGNEEGEMAVVSGFVPSTDNNLTENLSVDDPQQGLYSAWTEAREMGTQNQGMVGGEQTFASSLLGDDFDFVNYDGGNNMF
ncbi:hypothetical protein BDP67DRAFT_573985 [Colletotrichum lupini]|nr:hypothetical protein BDP67DRAFT_573985 [Colletotrichum lupini]